MVIRPLNHPSFNHQRPLYRIIQKFRHKTSSTEEYTRENVFFPRLSLFLSLFDSVSFATAVSKLTLLPFSSLRFCWSTLLHIQDVAQRTSSKSDSCVESCFSSNRIVGGIKTTSQRNAYGRMKVSRTTSRNGYQWIPMPLLFPCFLFLFLGFFVLLVRSNKPSRGRSSRFAFVCFLSYRRPAYLQAGR